MYIALKWLLTLSFLLWLALCITKIIQTSNQDESYGTEFHCHTNSVKEDSQFLWLIEKFKYVFVIITFTFIGMVVLLCKNCKWTYRRTKLKIGFTYENILYYFKSGKVLKQLWQSSNKQPVNCNIVNKAFLYLIINYLMKEQKKLAKTLSDLQQDRNLDYKLDRLRNSRISNIYVEDSYCISEEYLTYKRSYIKLCCENIFLRSSLEKLVKEKKTIERNLLSIVTQVFLTNNNDLKGYCSKFVVCTKDDLLKADMKLEVQRFLAKSRRQALHSNISYNLCNLKKITLLDKVGSSECTGNNTKFREYFVDEMDNHADSHSLLSARDSMVD